MNLRRVTRLRAARFDEQAFERMTVDPSLTSQKVWTPRPGAKKEATACHLTSMTSERTPILPSSLQAPQVTSSRWRLAFVAAAVVTVAILAVVTLNVSPNLLGSVSLSTSSFTPTVTFPADANGQRDLLSFCQEKYVTQDLSHFDGAGLSGTYEQRYFVCGEQFFNKDNGTIFFYAGNEDTVLLYLNHTGLMWENAEEFNALLVFAEHRYFGQSFPFGDDWRNHTQYLSSTEALADFAVVIDTVKKDFDADVPVIAFGGSYGGMLVAWLRIKYPHIIDGGIAGSAPLLHWLGDPENEVDFGVFGRIVTFDMTPDAGASEHCAPNVRKANSAIARLGETAAGRATLAETMKLCNAEGFQVSADVDNLVLNVQNVFESLAMGNYHYPTSYITGGVAMLPARPMRVACEHLASEFDEGDDVALLSAFRDALGVFTNATGTTECNFPTVGGPPGTDTNFDGVWNYLYCSEFYAPSSTDGIHDAFLPRQSNLTEDDAQSMATWGIHIRPYQAQLQYGGIKAIRLSSNLVFSNGNYDPWSGTGVLKSLSDSVVAVSIEGGAHHVDLFFKHPMDPPSLTEAREVEKAHMHKWVNEFYDYKKQRTQ